MRSVRGFHFDRAAASVLTTSLSVCEENYLFLGSRLGNSLLLQFTEKDIGESTAVISKFFFFLSKTSVVSSLCKYEAIGVPAQV